MDVKVDSIPVEGGHMWKMVDANIPAVSVSAAKKQDGGIIISLANTSLEKKQEVEINLDGANVKTVAGEILTSKNVMDYNDFEHPDAIKPVTFKDAKLKKKSLKVKIPAKSIIVLNLK